MPAIARLLLAGLCCLLVLGMPAVAAADPDDHDHATHDQQPPKEPPFSGPPSLNITKIAGVPKEGTTNSDLAFWGDLAIAANYGGFRIFDISKPSQPELLTDFPCYGPQNDVSVYRIGGRLYLWQSIDRALTSHTCSATPNGTPIIQDPDDGGASRASYGFEGIRMFDITNPRSPELLAAVRTACGSHTHTLVPDKRNQRLFLYVSSYPLGSGITPVAQRNQDRPCVAPHTKISIVEVPFSDPTNMTVREQPLSPDTAFAPNRNPPFQACHDIQAVLSRNLAIGACAGDVQIWDISSRGKPTTLDENRHTHFHQQQWDFMHNAMATYDGKVFAFVDETGGGGGAECDGPAGQSSDDGFMYLYRAVKPGEPAGPEIGRYMTPRAQGTQICVTHNGSIIPVKDGRYLASLAYYQGGTSVVDFTNTASPREIAYIDDANSDAWSSYWYNDYVYSNGGLHRRAADGSTPCDAAGKPACSNPGFEVYRVTDEDGTTLRTRNWHHYNPQTQENFQETGR